ncbi:DUF4349 domain-containing protein [Nocardia takedensis]|uniref:DUF4349 domain-containing protein n=1 Tax=Nocardia takedensis TaxID=259390 RepID=UPI0003069192|nr:DUF4349 domain-containing protein [Nocardia takedensis]
MRKLALLCLGLTLTTLLAGCGSDETASSDGRSASTVAPAITPPGLREQAPTPADSGREQGGAEVTARKEVVTGSIDITADDPIAAAATVADRVRAAGGRLDSRTEQPGTDEQDPSATLTVRVPADRTDAFIDGLGGIGELTLVNTNRDDVTMQWEDLDAKIRALRASVDRLRALIAGATNTADLIAAENALSSRQGELDSLTAQQRRLDDQVALSSLTITLTAPESHTHDPGPSNFWDGLVSGWNSLIDFLQDAIVTVGKAVPWLVFLALLAGIGWGIGQLFRRRSTAGSPRARHATAGGVSDAASVAGSKESGATEASPSESDPSAPGPARSGSSGAEAAPEEPRA